MWTIRGVAPLRQSIRHPTGLCHHERKSTYRSTLFSLQKRSPKSQYRRSTTTVSSSSASSKQPKSIWSKLKERPVEYATIPAVAAFVGLTTNWMGVNMLFYPIEYTGTQWYRGDKECPYGLLGWQGVVPCKTERMAGRLVNIVTRRLLSLHEAFSRLDPHELAILLLPAVDEAIERDCGAHWAKLLRPILPRLLTRVISALQHDIENVLDLRSVVLSAFVRDKEVLVDLFQKVGRTELEFLVESGLGFGALLGLGQMGAWVISPRPWTLPVAGAFVGYITNWIAIKLLFEPADPVQVGPIVVQGLFESRQEQVSEEFGHFMATRVLSSHQLLDALCKDGTNGEFYAFLRRQLPYPIPSHILEAAIKAIVSCATSDCAKYPELHAYMTEQLDIDYTLSCRLKLLSPTDFEDLLHPVFQEDEIILISVGGVLGAAAGLAQTRLGWGGPGAIGKAYATLAFVGASSAAYFFTKKDPPKEDRPTRLRRRNTVLRLGAKTGDE